MNDDLREFLARTTAAAEKLGMKLEERAVLAANEFPGGSEVALQATHLPNTCLGALVGRHPVLFGRLPDTPDASAVRDSVRRYRNQCVVARSHLLPEQALDLHLWLLGPTASAENPDWRALALAAERDERVARKLVWLRPEDPERTERSFANFVARTFLARPWATISPQPGAQLDRLSGLVAVAGDLNIPPDILRQWFELAESDLEDGPELVDRFIEVWKEATE